LARLAREAHVTPFDRRILAAVAEKQWRGEVGLCKQFGGVDQHKPTVDALFYLVRSGRLDWFGAENRGDVPLRYRVTGLGRAYLATTHGGGAETDTP
jgi:hypothetical protein